MHIDLWLTTIVGWTFTCRAQLNNIPKVLQVPLVDSNFISHSHGDIHKPTETVSPDHGAVEKLPSERWDSDLADIAIMYPMLRPDLFLTLFAQSPADCVPEAMIHLASLHLSTHAGEQHANSTNFPGWLSNTLVATGENGQKSRYKQSRDILVQQGLLQIFEEGTLVCVRVPKAVQQHVKMRGGMLLHRRWYLSVLVAACKQLGDRRDGPMSHKQLVELMPDPDLDWESLSQLGLDDVEVFNVLNQMSSTYYHALLFEEAERIALQAVGLSRKVFRAGDLRLLDCNENLAAAYWMRGNRLDSEKLQLDVVRSRQVVLGTAHPDTQRAMQALSHYYFWWHEWSKAHDLRKQLVAVNKDAHGESDQRTLIAMHSLARLYRDTGEFAQAEGVQTELLALEQAAFGEDDERTMRTTAGLVATHRKRGQYEEALALQTKLVADRERILGTEHEQTVRSVAELATLHRSQGQYDKAQLLQLRVVTTMVKTHGQESDATMLQMAELAVVYMLDGKREMAQEIVAEIVSAHRETTPDEQKPSSRVIRELAETYLDQYMYKEAAILLEHTDLMIKASFGEDVETDLNSTGLLARAYMFSDRWKEAEDVLLTAWDGRHDSAHDHWEYKVHILLGLHTLYKTHGPLIKAEMPLLELLGPIDQVEPLRNIGKEGWLKELVDIYMGERRWKDADGMLNTLMGIRIARYGQTDVRTQESMRDLVIVKWKQRKWQEAARLTCRHYWRYKFVKPRAIMILLTLLWICMGIILWFAPKGTIGALLILQAVFVPPLSVLVGEVIGGIIMIVSY